MTALDEAIEYAPLTEQPAAKQELAQLRAELDAAKVENKHYVEAIAQLLERVHELEMDVHHAKSDYAELDALYGKLEAENAELKRRLAVAEAKENEE